MDKDYVPYGPEWDKEMMKWSKKDLINKLRKTLTQPDSPPVAGEATETAQEAIQNALYATGNLNTSQCETLAEGILQYIKDYGLKIVPASHHGSVDIGEVEDAARDYATEWEPELEKVSMDSFTKGVDWAISRYAPSQAGREGQEENSRPFFIDEVRSWLSRYEKEEISFSKFVELLNDKVYGKYEE